MCIYGTEAESSEIAAITRYLPYYQIIDPSALQSEVDKSNDGMRYFFRVIDYCHALVFSRLLGKITSGVGLEVSHAITRHVTVYELDNGKIYRIITPVEFLSREETLKQYALWRTTGTKRSKQTSILERSER